MLDLQKYLKRAAADPGFKAKLLKNANQAIKDEFGEDLPYELKCKEKLVFEVEPMDGLSDAELSNVAGGTTIKNAMPVDEWKKTMEKAGYVVDMYLDSRSDCGVFFRCYRPEDEMPFKESYYPCRDANGKLWMEV